MAGDADGLLARADHFVAGLSDEMITVALNAFTELTLIKRRFVRTDLEQLSLARMARPADIRDRSYSRRRRAMIAMTIVAGRRGEVLSFIKSLGVDARLVICILIARNPEPAHVVRVGMTFGACFGDVRRIN